MGNESLAEAPMPKTHVPHRPVLLRETLAFFQEGRAGWYVDGTLGAGGHAEAFLDASPADCRLLGIDRDVDALEIAGERLERFGDRFVSWHGRHEDLVDAMEAFSIETLAGMWLDLGVSSMQFDRMERGFSFRGDAPLDMRMDQSRGVTAAEWLASADETKISKTLRRWGDEKQSRRIAKAIVARRETKPVTSTADLASLVEQNIARFGPRPRIHPATRTFLALRIIVNEEIVGLDEALQQAILHLQPGARLAAIAFHSTEDRVVKRTFRSASNRCNCPPNLPVCGCGREDLVRLLTTRSIRADEQEVEENPRSRSASLRAVERLS